MNISQRVVFCNKSFRTEAQQKEQHIDCTSDVMGQIEISKKQCRANKPFSGAGHPETQEHKIEEDKKETRAKWLMDTFEMETNIQRVLTRANAGRNNYGKPEFRWDSRKGGKRICIVDNHMAKELVLDYGMDVLVRCPHCKSSPCWLNKNVSVRLEDGSKESWNFQEYLQDYLETDDYIKDMSIDKKKEDLEAEAGTFCFPRSKFWGPQKPLPQCVQPVVDSLIQSLMGDK